MSYNSELRLARVEAITNRLRSEMDEVLRNNYDQAVSNQDEESAATYARAIRNKLLEASDANLAFDRLLPEAPTGTTFSAWQEWLRTLAGVVTSDWSEYRKALRDLPEQEGFPFTIEWPIAPTK